MGGKNSLLAEKNCQNQAQVGTNTYSDQRECEGKEKTNI